MTKEILVDDAYHKNRLNEDGTLTLKLKKEDKFGNKVEIKYTEDYNVREDFYHDEDQILEGESIIQCIKDNDEIKSGNYILKVNGELINNGEISMTVRGANTVGQDVYLWKHEWFE